MYCSLSGTLVVQQFRVDSFCPTVKLQWNRVLVHCMVTKYIAGTYVLLFILNPSLVARGSYNNPHHISNKNFTTD